MENKRLEQIQRKIFNYFMDYTNFNENQKGYGLTIDETRHTQVASIAATGFMLSSLVIGVKEGYISYEEAYQKAYRTLLTLRDHIPHYEGFFAHFVNIETGERLGKTEYSTIDTALCLCGVIVCDSFFNKKELSEIAFQILDRVNYEAFIFEKDNKKVLHMAYNPDRGGDYVIGKPGFIHHWSMFAEQLMIYVMMAGSKYYKHAKEVYEGFNKSIGTYEGISYIYSPGNSLFIYQFPLAWLDLKNVYDQEGINWFLNAQKAILAHEKAARQHEDVYQTFKPSFFGFSASDTPKGYRIYGGLPNTMNKLDTDGTVSPFSMVGSLIFVPDLALKAIQEMDHIDGLEGKYGYYDGFNFDCEHWISDRYISINKGLELLMINNYLSQTIHTFFMAHPIIKKGMEVLQWKKR